MGSSSVTFFYPYRYSYVWIGLINGKKSRVTAHAVTLDFKVEAVGTAVRLVDVDQPALRCPH